METRCASDDWERILLLAPFSAADRLSLCLTLRLRLSVDLLVLQSDSDGKRTASPCPRPPVPPFNPLSLAPSLMSENGSTGTGSNNASRHEKSLGLLTTRFVSLLQDAKDGVLDLKVVSTVPFPRVSHPHVPVTANNEPGKDVDTSATAADPPVFPCFMVPMFFD